MLIKKYTQTGFTLIELMIVVAIIGILASLTIPNYIGMVTANKITAAVKFSEQLQDNVNQFYKTKQSFPSNNNIAGLPPADKLISPQVNAIHIENGAFHLTFSKAASRNLDGKILSIRPVYVADSPKTPISWICANAPIPQGMTAAGLNKTNIDYTLLPINCRDLSGKLGKQSEIGDGK